MVIADTSPLNYLILVGADGVLPRMYGEVTITTGVMRELSHSGTPAAVTRWISSPPDWLKIVGIRQIGPEELGDLGLGEREAIVLATEHGSGVLLIIDDAQGRLLASRRGIDTTGTLGVLDVAAEKGWLDLRTAISQLRRTTFYAKPSLYKRLLDRDAARRKV